MTIFVTPQIEREREFVRAYWSETCDQWLRELIVNHGAFYGLHVQRFFRYTIGLPAWEEFSKKAQALREAGEVEHVHYNVPLHFARHLVETRGWVVRRFPVSTCELCLDQFHVESHLPSTIENISIKVILAAPFCPKCYESPGSERGRLGVSAEGLRIALAGLADVAAAFGFIPTQAFKSDSVLSRLPEQRILDALRAVVQVPEAGYYARNWGSWFRALVAAGVLDEEARQTGRGTQCLAVDGHECMSEAEKAIDDWLTERGIVHVKDPSYPIHVLHNPKGRRRADWRVGEFYLELFGLLGDPEYDRRVSEKRVLAGVLGLKVVELTYEDISDPGRKLGFLDPDRNERRRRKKGAGHLSEAN